LNNVVIIGNGIAGISTARNIRKISNHKIIVIGSETEYFFSRTALMYIFMGHMKYEHTKPYEDWFWKKNDIDLVFDHVEEIDTDQKSLRMKSGSTIDYDTLVLAIGSKTAKYNWPGQDIEGVRGLYSVQDLEYFDQNAKDTSNAVIIGGGLIGVELAEMLHTRDIDVTIIIREEAYWQNVLPKEESEVVSKHIKSHGVKIISGSEIQEITGSDGHVSGIITKAGDRIECQMVGITTGVVPNIDLIKNTRIETQKGILVDEYLLTSIPDIYAVGDCAEVRNPLQGRRSIEPVWYVGRMMGEIAGKNIGGEPIKYKPGNWFNSAKFFDLEYQTYGTVTPRLSDDEDYFFWKDGQDSKCIKIVFDKHSQVFKGINAFGVRLRHEVIDDWLSKEKTVSFVVEHFKEANFDPEFYKSYVQEMSRGFEDTFGKSTKNATERV